MNHWVRHGHSFAIVTAPVAAIDPLTSALRRWGHARQIFTQGVENQLLAMEMPKKTPMIQACRTGMMVDIVPACAAAIVAA
jgi:glyoxylate carboligase